MTNKSLSILVLEPHPDDLLFSCHFFLKSLSEDFNLRLHFVTIESRNRRDGDAYINHNFRGRILSYCESSHPTEFYDSKFVVKNKREKNYNDILSRKYNEEYSILREDIFSKLVSLNPRSYDLIISPLGISHQTHMLLRETIMQLVSYDKLLFYRDQPYTNKQFGRIQLEELVSKFNLNLLTKIELDDNLIAEKRSMLKQYFPSELGLMHPLYEMPNFKRYNSEDIYGVNQNVRTLKSNIC